VAGVAVRIFASIADALEHTTPSARYPLTWNPVDHLLSRLAFGPSAASREQVNRGSIPEWYADQLRLGSTNKGYGAQPLVAAQGPLLALSPFAVRQGLKASGNEFGGTAMDQLTRVTLGLQTWSPAQLYETLVDFFANHLNVANHNGDVWNTRHAYDRDVIRAHAMGSFTEMLLASARHPAMLAYLNLATSTKRSVNENYGRELLELHTVGLEYSEADVREASYLLTGRKIDQYSEYTYAPADHWTGPVRVLGFSHPNSAASDGEIGADALIRYLAAHPATARRLAGKLCTRFVSDDPSPSLVDAVANAYRDSGTQILPMMSVIVRSDEFWASRGTKIRRPAENVVATLRILDVRPENLAKSLDALHSMTRSVGHVPLDWSPPTGYPDVAAAWRSSGTLASLWRLHLGVAAGWWKDAFAPAARTELFGGTPATSGEAVDLLGRRLTGGELADAHRAALQEFLGEQASTPMGNSALRWMLAPLVALILDGPQHAFR
jgi:hypothetical protein